MITLAGEKAHASMGKARITTARIIAPLIFATGRRFVLPCTTQNAIRFSSTPLQNLATKLVGSYSESARSY